MSAQDELLEAIRGFWAEMGYAPTVRELCDLTGRKSPATVYQTLGRMRRKGLVEWKSNSPRTLRVCA